MLIRTLITLAGVLLTLNLSLAQSGAQAVCPSGFALSGNQCRGVPTQCPAGTTLQNAQCVGMPLCPAGATIDNGQCVVTPTCGNGSTFNSKTAQCTSSPACGTEGKYSAEFGRCVEPAQCIPTIAGRRCSCVTGGEYREDGQLCIKGAPSCPAGTRFDPASKACG